MNWSFYDPETGIFTGRVFSGTSEEDLELNTHPGAAAIEGRYDHKRQKVDLETGEVVDYKPPKPSKDHEWDKDNKRWILKLEVSQARKAEGEKIAKIQALETRQLRPMRELAIDPTNEEAAKRLQSIEAEIGQLR